jgi:hypothetical protein
MHYEDSLSDAFRFVDAPCDHPSDGRTKEPSNDMLPCTASATKARIGNVPPHHDLLHNRLVPFTKSVLEQFVDAQQNQPKVLSDAGRLDHSKDVTCLNAYPLSTGFPLKSRNRRGLELITESRFRQRHAKRAKRWIVALNTAALLLGTVAQLKCAIRVYPRTCNGWPHITGIVVHIEK